VTGVALAWLGSATAAGLLAAASLLTFLRKGSSA
jgi:ABC-type uncharacterized transport system permease subunit